jgi:DNA polymerase-3 subunit epsilon
MRQIIFDTETTGLFHDKGDRIIEVGAVEVINFMPTGETFQTYIDPGRSVSQETIQITGITDEMLVGQPKFEDPAVVEKLLDFFGDAEIVAHNAKFDEGFLNMELKRCGKRPVPAERWIDSAAFARAKFPGSPASLDALCKRFDVNSEARTFHGALLDSQLLAEVWLELNGGRSRSFSFEDEDEGLGADGKRIYNAKQRPSPLKPLITEEELARHKAFVEDLDAPNKWYAAQEEV